jgi:hypothetical protein
MNQALYAHMNNKKKNPDTQRTPTRVNKSKQKSKKKGLKDPKSVT